jgi:hypothetical protein
VNIFIDTEFTDLSPDAHLLSLGAVAENGDEFYCELLPFKTDDCSPFVRRVVLPLLEGGEKACPADEFAERLAAWLARFRSPCLLSDSDWDIYVVRRALTGRAMRMPGQLRFATRAGHCEAMLLTLRPLAGKLLEAFEESVTAHFAADPRQHHALVDARALRAGMFAARAASGRG